MKWFRFAVGFIAVCVGVMMSLHSVFAMQVEPATTDMVIEPGKTAKMTFTVTNQESKPEQYYFSIQKFVPQGESGDASFLPVTETAGLPSWTYLSAPSVVLAPGQSERVIVEVRVPEDAPRGSAQEAIFISTNPLQTGGLVVGLRTGILLFVRIGAEQNERLAFANVETPTSWYAHLPVPIGVTIENTGGSYEIPEGIIRVSNAFGQVRTELPFNRDRSRILPGSRRHFVMSWQDREPSKDQGFWSQVGEELSNGGIGRYTVRFAPAGKTQLPATELFQVWIWPTHLLKLLAGIIIVLVIGFYWLRRRIRERLLRSHV